jgi:signal transduction histidine kinase
MKIPDRMNPPCGPASFFLIKGANMNKTTRTRTQTILEPPVREGSQNHCARTAQTTRIGLEEADRITRHNLLTPLSSVISLSQLMLLDSNLTQRQLETVRLIAGSAQRMLDMIFLSQRLFLMEEGRYELHPVAVDLARILWDIWTELESLLSRRNVCLELEREGWPLIWDDPFMVRGETLLCYSLLANLIRNAIEASPCGGGVTVSLERFSGCYVIISNTGEVPVELRDVFFEKYATSGKKGGLGLGTYSARLMARAMGGDVELDCSRPGATIVRVCLPCNGSTL